MLQEATRREKVDLDLLRRHRDHDDHLARELLVLRFAPLVRSIARTYLGRGVDLDELQRIGTAGLSRAIERVDATAGRSFAVAASSEIHRELRRAVRLRRRPGRPARPASSLVARTTATGRWSREAVGPVPRTVGTGRVVGIAATPVDDPGPMAA